MKIRPLVVGLGLMLVLTAARCGGEQAADNSGANNSEASQPAADSAKPTTPAGLKIEDIKVGSGAAAKAGDTVTVHYTGTLTNGKKFDSSKDHGQPFTFHLGAGEVIKGWDQGVAGMKVGGVRKLTIPPDLAYGNRDVGGGLIPANSTLLFEVELLKIGQ